MKKTLIAMVFAASGVAAMTIPTASSDTGEAFKVSHSTVSVGRSVTVSGKGCDVAESPVVSLTVTGPLWLEERRVKNTDAGWEVTLQPREAGEATIEAACQSKSEAWKYAPATVTVTSSGTSGLEIEPLLALSDEIVTAGRSLYVSGWNCFSEELDGRPAWVNITIGDVQAKIAANSSGAWQTALIAIPAGTPAGELPVNAVCEQPDGVKKTFKSTTLTVVSEGDLGIDPSAGPTNSAAASPSPSVSPSMSATETAHPSPSPSTAQPGNPGLPHSGW